MTRKQTGLLAYKLDQRMVQLDKTAVCICQMKYTTIQFKHHDRI